MGTHFCLFYETEEDLLETLVSYCRSGLEKGEYCLWVVADYFTVDEARDALQEVVPHLDRHLADSNLELVPTREWFGRGGMFEHQRARDIGLSDSLGRAPDVTAACVPPGYDLAETWSSAP